MQVSKCTRVLTFENICQVAFVASRDIAAGEQITYDYRGRLHAVYCEKNIPNFKPMGPLPAAQLASLQKA
jgi:hypothetical protein